MSGVPLGLVLAWEFLSRTQRVRLGNPRAPRLITFQTFVPFHPIADAGRMRSASGQRESAANRRLETHGGKPKGGCGTECKPSPRQRLIRGRFFCFGHLMRVRPKEHASMSSSSQVVPNTPDVLVRNEGTVFLFCPVAWKLQRESGTRSSRQSLTNWHHSF